MLPIPHLPPRAARTRSALIAAGFELLAVKPIDAIPIDEVVAQAGVAKGSFFNHFADKHAFAAAIAAEVRLELEDQVARANAGVADPVERIANGMRTCAAFAINNPMRTAALLRGSGNVTDRSHPLNKGVADDFDQAARLRMLSQEARGSGVLFWLGLCQVLMASLVDPPGARPEKLLRVREMIVLGLTGLGVERSDAARIADGCCATL